jgi:hypothetical protein
MNRAIFSTLAVVSLVTLAGCNSVRCMFVKGRCLSYEQYLAVDQDARPAPTVESVLTSLGKPAAVHDRDGATRQLDYYTYSLTGDLKLAEFTFDENGNLVKKWLW